MHTVNGCIDWGRGLYIRKAKLDGNDVGVTINMLTWTIKKTPCGNETHHAYHVSRLIRRNVLNYEEKD